MQVEKPIFNDSLKEIFFENWVNKNQIQQFLFDFDDTICATGKVFRQQMSLAYDFLAANNPQFSRDQWQKEIENHNDKLFEEFGVCPDRWNHVVDRLTHKYPMTLENQLKTKEIFAKIYDTPLEMLEGSQKALELLNKIDIPIGIVTHANKDWTRKKYHWLDLQRFLSWDNVYIVNENGHKNHESWQDALTYFKVDPKNCAVVGDSPRSDIAPAQKVGIKHCFLIENPVLWTIHEASLDPNTKRIKNLYRIIDIGTEKL